MYVAHCYPVVLKALGNHHYHWGGSFGFGIGIRKIFAEYHPCRVEIVDGTSCLVSFASRADCVRMMIGMTKPLRRFRATRAAEDGELTDSDGEEEEGQIKLEKGDDVALVSEAGLFTISFVYESIQVCFLVAADESCSLDLSTCVFLPF
ncbi:hypothetical protein TELCIR_01602 [Teladorsagia circumcincta]|uniref:Uncharacterized protein n=1 Tax=Teladorsagia circumcincta TaxID=45464 RepID=A0A2G9V1G9_TELCI|nr:hypothetical protein TELCIR_01602 [Teladorsagia circumcincta]